MARTRGGFVYFIETQDHQHIKIGFSTNVKNRLAGLHTSYHEALHCIGWMPGDKRTEAALHVKFASIRQQGEWFSDGPELRAFIAELPLKELAEFDAPAAASVPIVVRRPRVGPPVAVPKPKTPKSKTPKGPRALRLTDIERRAGLIGIEKMQGLVLDLEVSDIQNTPKTVLLANRKAGPGRLPIAKYVQNATAGQMERYFQRLRLKVETQQSELKKVFEQRAKALRGELIKSLTDAKAELEEADRIRKMVKAAARTKPGITVGEVVARRVAGRKNPPQ